MRRTTVLALAVLAATASASASSTGANAGTTAPKESIVFFYQKISLSDESKFVGAQAVITSDQTNDVAAISTIHAAGALAIKYTNVYWYPANGTYEGIDIGAHKNWAFCHKGNVPYVGRIQDGVKWYYIDANETAARAAIDAYFDHLRSLGYDGIFFDRGSAALRGNKYAITWKASTCTGSPVHTRHRRFSDVYASVIHDAYSRGLTIYLNYAHPYSGSRLRPDPNDRDCRLGNWSACTFNTAIQKWTSEIVDENRGGNTPAAQFRYDLKLGASSEHHLSPTGMPRLVREIKVKSTNRRAAFFLWARTRLHRILTFVDTGDDQCGGETGCYRFGTYPELTEVVLGHPVTRTPRSLRCGSTSPTSCLWLRRYHGGMVAVNPTKHAQILRQLKIKVGSCRYVKDVYHSTTSTIATLGSDTCVAVITFRVPAHSGRVFVYGTTPW